MSWPNAMEICRTDLFTKEADLRQKYPDTVTEKILRIREMYNWSLANPQAHDREFVAELMQRHEISKYTAYADLNIVKALLPLLSTASRDYHRWRTNEMLIQTFQMAKSRKDTKTMERAASAYGKLNRVDLEDEQAMPYEMIVPQPFTATEDPRVLGIEPIPNLQQKISSMIAKYRKETIDIEDVQFEEIDLEFDTLFPTPKITEDGEESLL